MPALPLHPFNVGVTLRLAIIFVTPPFKAVKDGTKPLPDAANPIAELLLVQV